MEEPPELQEGDATNGDEEAGTAADAAVDDAAVAAEEPSTGAAAGEEQEEQQQEEQQEADGQQAQDEEPQQAGDGQEQQEEGEEQEPQPPAEQDLEELAEQPDADPADDAAADDAADGPRVADAATTADQGEGTDGEERPQADGDPADEGVQGEPSAGTRDAETDADGGDAADGEPATSDQPNPDAEDADTPQSASRPGFGRPPPAPPSRSASNRSASQAAPGGSPSRAGSAHSASQAAAGAASSSRPGSAVPPAAPSRSGSANSASAAAAAAGAAPSSSRPGSAVPAAPSRTGSAHSAAAAAGAPPSRSGSARSAAAAPAENGAPSRTGSARSTRAASTEPPAADGEPSAEQSTGGADPAAAAAEGGEPGAPRDPSRPSSRQASLARSPSPGEARGSRPTSARPTSARPTSARSTANAAAAAADSAEGGAGGLGLEVVAKSASRQSSLKASSRPGSSLGPHAEGVEEAAPPPPPPPPAVVTPPPRPSPAPAPRVPQPATAPSPTSTLELKHVAPGLKALDVEVAQGPGLPFKVVRVLLDSTQLDRKPYLGGYRSKSSGATYLHACTQTPRQPKYSESDRKLSRDTQTVKVVQHSQQTKREAATQMARPGVVIDETYDRVRTPGKYQTADERAAIVEAAVRTIQRYSRGWSGRKRAEYLREKKLERELFLREQELRAQQEAEEHRRKEIERRMHPRSAADFEILYNELEAWRLQETRKIKDAGLPQDKEQMVLKQLLDKETKLLQTIDRLKINANHENKDIRIQRTLGEMGKPKRYELKNGGRVEVHTPFTTRAKELQQLYNGLNLPSLTIDERLDVLLHVKWTVKEFECNLTHEIVDLIDREANLLNMGRSPAMMEGLRKRISSLFLNFIETPTYNPEAVRFQIVPMDFEAFLYDQADRTQSMPRSISAR